MRWGLEPQVTKRRANTRNHPEHARAAAHVAAVTDGTECVTGCHRNSAEDSSALIAQALAAGDSQPPCHRIR